MAAIAQGQCRLIFVTLKNKFYDFWNTGDQCLFCDINATLEDQKAGGEDVFARIDPEVVAEVIKIAFAVDHHYSWLYISGGTNLSKDQGQTELEFYITRLNATREKLQVWNPATFQVAPYAKEGLKRLHETGVESIQPNIEVWDRKLFRWICPEKEKHIGYDEWIRRCQPFPSGTWIRGRGSAEERRVALKTWKDIVFHGSKIFSHPERRLKNRKKILQNNCK